MKPDYNDPSQFKKLDEFDGDENKRTEQLMKAVLDAKEGDVLEHPKQGWIIIDKPWDGERVTYRRVARN